MAESCGCLILDAIDQLRKRKARPDLDRICHMLERRHGLKSPEVNEELKKLVNEGIVIKVDYKGNTSYRNAAKWIRTKTQFFGSVYNSSDISSVVLEAVSALTLPSPDKSKLKSASIQDIEQYLLKRDAQSNLNIAALRIVLEKEVAKKSLHQLPSGEYVPLKSNQEAIQTQEKSPLEVAKKPCVTPAKKIKLSSEASPTENSQDAQSNYCDFCSQTSSANKKGEAEELLSCKDCGAKAHASCMDYTKLFGSFPHPHKWQCPDCKACVACGKSGKNEDLVTCYICFKAYHMECHDPVIYNKSVGTWLCSDCDDNPKETKYMKIKPKPPSYEEKKCNIRAISNSSKDEFQKSIEQYPNCIPLVKEWSIQNVEVFFRSIGFGDDATAFREQEIDGLSLLLMKRNDVLLGLGIKLGPALKMYKHVVKLQSRVNTEIKPES